MDRLNALPWFVSMLPKEKTLPLQCTFIMSKKHNVLSGCERPSFDIESQEGNTINTINFTGVKILSISLELKYYQFHWSCNTINFIGVKLKYWFSLNISPQCSNVPPPQIYPLSPSLLQTDNIQQQSVVFNGLETRINNKLIGSQLLNTSCLQYLYQYWQESVLTIFRFSKIGTFSIYDNISAIKGNMERMYLNQTNKP